MFPGGKHEEVLDLLTIARILDHLPHLQTLCIGNCEIRSEPAPPADAPGYNIKELVIKDMHYAIGIENISEVLSLFHHIGRIHIGNLPGWVPDVKFAFRRAIAALQIENLEFPKCFHPEFIHALCAGLAAHTDLTSLRKVICGRLTRPVAQFVSLAPNLQALGFDALNPDRSLWIVRPFRSLTTVTLSADFCPRYSDMRSGILLSWNEYGNPLRTLVAFTDLREIILSLRVYLQKGELIALQTANVYSSLEFALLQIYDVRILADTLDMFQSLRSLVVELDFSRSLPEVFALFNRQPERCAAILKMVMMNILPQKYTNMMRTSVASL